MERVYTQVDRRSGVSYEIWIDREDTPVKGNALCSGDPAVDRSAENAITRKLRNGDQWAWCRVKVVAAKGEHEGCDYLGACSYKGVREFIRDGYYKDMKTIALADLNSKREL